VDVYSLEFTISDSNDEI